MKHPRLAVLGMAMTVVVVALVVMLPGMAGAGDNRAAPAPSPSASPDPGSRKQELEIEKLEQETGTEARLRNWLSSGGFVIALAAAAFSVIQYVADRRRDRDIRIQEQFSRHLLAVAEYPQAAERTSASLLAALTSLDDVLAHAGEAPDYRSQVTAVIHMVVMHDLDFEDPKQARFDHICLTNWPDYAAWLRAKPQRREFVLYRYRQAFRVLAEKYPGYFDSMTVTPAGGLAVGFYIPEPDYLHFQELLASYRIHLDALDDTTADEHVGHLGESLGNADLARELIRATR